MYYFALIGVLPKYFNSEWSVAQFHLQEGSHYTVAFGLQKNTVIILGMDGRYGLKKRLNGVFSKLLLIAFLFVLDAADSIVIRKT